MRTTLNVDDKLFAQLLEVTSAKTKTEAVREALKEFIRLKRMERLLAQRGTLNLEDNWRALRATEVVRRGRRK